MSNIKCFLIERTGRTKRFLRRYIRRVDHTEWTCASGWHNARVEITPTLDNSEWEVVEGANGSRLSIAKTDARWPATCDLCDYAFTEGDEWQLFPQHEYHDPLDSSKGTFVWRDDDLYGSRAPVGSLLYADWLSDVTDWHGSDGKALFCMTPGGMWLIDGPASNCTKKDDKTHRCWIRHGVPPDVTVDKNGNTCGAGAGSIVMVNYHGFLRSGELTDC